MTGNEYIERWKAEVEYDQKLSTSKALALKRIERSKKYLIGKNKIPTIKEELVREIIEEME